MSYSIGGIVIADMEFTRSWGLSPASASITGVGAGSLVVGGDVLLTIGADSFYGILSNFVEQTQDGQRAKISFVDNRVKLIWNVVFCLFNRVEVRADNPATPGIDRQKRYAHVLPENAETGLVTYTNAPFSAEEIIGYLFSAPTLSHSWGGIFDSAQGQPVHEIDALTGKKLGNILQEISDAQGLLFTLVGSNTLYWARKGDGGTPGYDGASTDDISDGEAVSAADTEVTVVGDRNRNQEIEIDLEPDWNSAYEDFWLEADWHDNLSGITGLGGGDFASEAELAAKMRTFTVRELVAAYGTGYADYGMWGEVSRMEIPVWTYLHDIVYKAYRVPRGYTLDTGAAALPLDSLELVEGLLCAINYDLGGGMSEDTTQLYPDAKAFLLVQGQQLGLLDPTKQRVLTQAELDRQATEFSPNNRFNLDTRNKTIIFQDPVFISNDLFIFLNQGTDAPDSLQGIAVPNADATVDEAQVKAALVWDADRYKQTFGSGERKGSHYVPGLSGHFLNDGTEVTYGDNETADEKAAIIAQSLIAQQSIYESGGFKRNGATGTALTGAIDRVTVSLTFDGGITERVEFSKERAQSNFEAERDLERKQRSKDLFPGQQNLVDEAKQLRLIAKVTKELKRSPLQPVYGSLAAAMEKPVGAPDCSVAKIYSTDIWLAGSPVFLGTDGHPAPDGESFAGIVIADQSTGILNCATQGIVPVRIKGPWKTNDTIGIDKGLDQTAKVGGELFLGRVVSEAYPGTGTVLGMVQLGAGAPVVDEFPFQVVGRPHKNETTGEVDSIELGVISNSHLLNAEDRDTYEEDNSDWGLLDDDRITGWFGLGEIDFGSTGDKIWLQIQLDPDDQSIVAIDVMHGPVGEAESLWDEYPDPISINVDDPANPYQEFYNQIIAEITDPNEDPRPGLKFTLPDGEIQITQILKNNLMMVTAHTNRDADQANLPLLVATPWWWPGTDNEGNANEIPSEGDLMTPWEYGAAPELEIPFQVISRVNPATAGDETETNEVGVISNSHVFNSEDRDTNEEENSDWGLLNDDQTDGWLDPGSIGQKIWLQIELDPDDQSIVAIDVMHGGVGGELWSTYPNPIEINTDDPGNPYQQFYHQIIAEVTDPEQDPRPGLLLTNGATDEVQITQLLFHNLMMATAHSSADSLFPNLPLLVPVPWNLPPTAIDGSADEINDVPDPGEDDPMTPWEYGAPPNAEIPFQVISKLDSATGVSQLGVISNSHLFNSENKDTYEEDNSDWGLLDDDRLLGWFDAGNAGDKIWLQIELDPTDQSIVAIDVRHGPVGPTTPDDWQYFPDPIEINTDSAPFQQFYHQIIAEITDPAVDPRPGFTVHNAADDEVQVTQLLFNNLMLTTAQTTKDADEPNLPIIVAIPWNLPGTSIDGAADEINDEDDVVTPWSFGGGGVTVKDVPWKISIKENVTGDPPVPDGTFAVHLRPGTINNILPSNMFDNFDIADTGTFYVVLDVTTDGDSITDASLDVINTPPETVGSAVDVAPAEFHLLLGIVVDKVPFQLIDYLLNVNPQVTVLTLRDSPTPGQPFWNINYTWGGY